VIVVRAILFASIATMTSGARPANADPVQLVVAGGESQHGAIARAELTGQLGPAIAAARVDDTGHQLAAVAGVAPRVHATRAVSAHWDGACLERLAGTSADRERCWVAAARRAPDNTRVSDGWLGAVAGARRDELGRVAALAAIRIHPTDDVLGDVIELGASGVVAGRDRLFVQHMRFAPGWYARAQTRIWHLVLGGELGTTGLATRTAAGAFRAETFASATIGVAVPL
jgi:hypothetical protein